MGERQRQLVVRAVTVVAVVAVGAALVMSVAVRMGAASWVFASLPGGPGRPSADEMDRPPSERGPLPSRRSASRPAADAAQDPTVPPEGAYQELRCTFSGRAALDPGLPFRPFGTSHQTMRLEPDASFACHGPPADTSGTVDLQATFDALALFSGVGDGGGVIHWDDSVTGAAGPAHDVVSHFDTEIELLYPDLVTWVTIYDGPYQGFRGKLVLSDWRRVERDGRIVEIVFAPTDVTFSPV